MGGCVPVLHSSSVAAGGKAHAKIATLQGVSRRGSAGHPLAPHLPWVSPSAALQGPLSLGLRFEGGGRKKGVEGKQGLQTWTPAGPGRVTGVQDSSC